jgi:hypothetical protein
MGPSWVPSGGRPWIIPERDRNSAIGVPSGHAAPGQHAPRSNEARAATGCGAGCGSSSGGLELTAWPF